MTTTSEPRTGATSRRQSLAGDPLWYRDAVIYEVHVRAFHDGNGDGIGDFVGLAEKLDYLEQLGVTAIWLLPFYVSPLRDDGYDIADYRTVHPNYGTLRDFQRFLDAAHARGLRVITELVLNHTSDQHPWFQRARRAEPATSARDFYVWSDDAHRYADARIIFKDFERSNWTWDTVAESYYWHRFYSHQPDLNFENPAVRRAMFEVVDYWLSMGVDGLRLDAVPYLFEEEGTSCENLPSGHAFLKELRAHVDKKFPGRMLLAEANQWPEDAAAYFGDGDECHMAFHFPVMPRLFMAVRMEDSFPITEILDQTPAIPENAQWAMFLRNHDELTLEMVTDEERDYMNRVYARDARARVNFGIRRRLAPLLRNNRRQIELMNALLMSLPGTPVLYYGDEIGMGDNIYLGDRDSVRTPMQWSADRNAGFSRANPQRLFLPIIIDSEYHYETVNVEAHQSNPSSLLWWMRRLVALRKHCQAFARGTFELVDVDNRKVLAFLRRHENETVLVVANLSRFVQGVHLDIASLAGSIPVELFGGTHFPPIRQEPYFLSMGPHTFFWFRIQAAEPATTAPAGELPVIHLDGSWTTVVSGQARRTLEALLPRYIASRRWFGGKARRMRTVTVSSVVPWRRGRETPCLYCVLTVDYFEGEPERYALPLSVVGAEGERIARDAPWAVVARIIRSGEEQEPLLLVDASATEAFPSVLYDALLSGSSLRDSGRSIVFEATRAFARLRNGTRPHGVVMGAEQSNTSINFEGRVIVKMLRRLEDGTHPEVEVRRALATSELPASVPDLLGWATLRDDSSASLVAVADDFVPNQCDAFSLFADRFADFLDDILPAGVEAPPKPPASATFPSDEPPPELAAIAGETLFLAQLLGRRTAELHLALAASEHPDFAPEPMVPFYRKALAQGLRSRARSSLLLLRRQLRQLPPDADAIAREVLGREQEILARMESVGDRPLDGKRIRCHGDFHLGQVLFTGRDFIIVDFEGEPARPLGERRIKRSPLRDVAGMCRSFHYVTVEGFRQVAALLPGGEARQAAAAWATAWYQWVTGAYLRAYREAAAPGSLLPNAANLGYFLDILMLEKALYEVEYELENRPARVVVPLAGILDALGHRDVLARLADQPTGSASEGASGT